MMSDGEQLQLYVESWEGIILIECFLCENYLPTP